MSASHAFAATRGGIYEPNDLEGTLHSRFAQSIDRLRYQIPSLLRDTAKWNRNLTLEVCFFAQMKPSAAVELRGNDGCIGLSIGLLISLRRVIDASLTHSDGSVPFIPVCLNKPVNLDLDLRNIDYLVEAHDDRQGLCDDSALVGDFIFNLAVLYIFHHELRHIFDGHLDWIGRGEGMSALEDDGVSRTDGVNIFDRRVLEYSADNGAASTLCSTYIFPLIGDHAPTEHIGSVCWCIMFAVHLTHKLIETNELKVDPSRSVHPPANIRTHISRVFIVNALYHSTTINEDLNAYVMTGASTAENLWHRVFDTVYDHKAFLSSMAKTKPLLSLYNRRWERIKPKLEKLKRIEIIPARKSRTTPGVISLPPEVKARMPLDDPRLRMQI